MEELKKALPDIEELKKSCKMKKNRIIMKER